MNRRPFVSLIGSRLLSDTRAEARGATEGCRSRRGLAYIKNLPVPRGTTERAKLEAYLATEIGVG